MQTFYIPLLLFIIIYCSLSVECKEASTKWTTNQLPQENEAYQVADVVQCPLWFFYNNIINQCECYNSIPHFNGLERAYPNSIKCVEQSAFISYNYYMTHSNGQLFFSYSLYFDADGYDKPVGEPGFIELPANISDLNTYMCGPANRKGLSCSECIDDFGPSATSPKFKCSNCTNAYARYSVVFYLLSELLPVSIFYFTVLIFQINLTSAPMVSFILYSQLVSLVINYVIGDPDQMKYSLDVLSTFYGIWSLDFFRYVIPPFCISSNLKIVHIFYLKSISTVFPFFLIGITWISIEMYSHNYKVVVWPWRALNNILLKHFKVTWNSNRTVVDAFATFFLLSYAKLIFILLTPLYPITVYKINDTTHMSNVIHQPALDPTVDFLSKHHIPYVILSILIFCTAILPPVLILALYPIRTFRTLLFKIKCCRFMASINFFVEKFYACYRDGLDGGRDMRSCASLHFFFTLVGYVLWTSYASYYLISILFLVCSFLNVIVQPYKEKYMAITDALIFANAAILSVTLDKIIIDGFHVYFYQIALRILATLPMLWLVCFVAFKVFKTKIKVLLKIAREKLPCCNHLLNCGNQNEDNEVECVQQVGNFNNNLPDRMLRPEQYMQWGYDSLS